MFTYTIHFEEPGALGGSTQVQTQCMGSALGWFAIEYPRCLVLFVTFSLNRPS
mgnify:CR=1 FL=1